MSIHSGTNSWALQMISNRKITHINSHTSSPSVLHRPENQTEAVLSDNMDIKSAAPCHWSVPLISRGSTDIWISAESESQSHDNRSDTVSIKTRKARTSARKTRVSVCAWRLHPTTNLSIPRLRTYEVNKDNDNTEICKYEHRCNRDYPILDTHFWTNQRHYELLLFTNEVLLIRSSRRENHCGRTLNMKTRTLQYRNIPRNSDHQ